MPTTKRSKKKSANLPVVCNRLQPVSLFSIIGIIFFKFEVILLWSFVVRVSMKPLTDWRLAEGLMNRAVRKRYCVMFEIRAKLQT